jgi:hypothetical protein
VRATPKAADERLPEGIPPPPDEAPSNPPSFVDAVLGDTWRLHDEDDPTVERTYPTGKYRFDAPTVAYGVTYVGHDKIAIYNEVYGDEKVIPSSAADRRRSRIWSTRPLMLLALTDASVLTAFDLDLRVCTEKPYDTTQLWSQAWHRWYPDLDGLQFVARKSSPHLTTCLYLDRCSAALRFDVEGTIADLRSDGLRAARRYRLSPLVFFP